MFIPMWAVILMLLFIPGLFRMLLGAVFVCGTLLFTGLLILVPILVLAAMIGSR